MRIGERPQLILLYHNFCGDATENPLRRDFFGAYENENLCSFPR